MGYDHASWKSYGKEIDDFIVEINIREISGAPLDHFISTSSAQFRGILKIMQEKYGIISNLTKQIPVTMVAVGIMVKAGIPFDIIDKVKENLESKGFR
jgi:hypothetical protein